MLQPWKREELASSPSMLQHFIDVVSYWGEHGTVTWMNAFHHRVKHTPPLCVRAWVCVRGRVRAFTWVCEHDRMCTCLVVWKADAVTTPQRARVLHTLLLFVHNASACLSARHRTTTQPSLGHPGRTQQHLWQIHTLSDLIINDQCGKGTQHTRGKHLCSNSMVDLVGSNWLKCTPNYIPVFSHQPTLLSPSSVTLNILLSLI